MIPVSRQPIHHRRRFDQDRGCHQNTHTLQNDSHLDSATSVAGSAYTSQFRSSLHTSFASNESVSCARNRRSPDGVRRFRSNIPIRGLA